MTKLAWDKIDERLYETGIDRGVLYLANAQGRYDNGVAWNGLTSIKETFQDDKLNPHYFDGVKYLDSYNVGDYTATLGAFTYPDEFVEIYGMNNIGNGLYADDQRPQVFGLSYRTLIGSQLQGTDEGYQVHLIYNLSAVESGINYQNGSESLDPIDFEWDLTSVPEKTPGYRDTAHLILDSRYIKLEILEAIEDIIYGTEDDNPRLPALIDLIDIVLNWSTKIIVPQITTGLADLVNGIGDLTELRDPGVFYALPTTRLEETELPGIFVLEDS